MQNLTSWHWAVSLRNTCSNIKELSMRQNQYLLAQACNLMGPRVTKHIIVEYAGLSYLLFFNVIVG
jgi:hypothetical protein